MAYKHEPEYQEYEEPSHGKYDDGYGSYEEYDLKPTYKHKYAPTHKKSAYRHKRSVYGYGGDSYSKSYSTYSSYQPSYRHKRSVRYGYGGKSYSFYEEPIYAKSYEVEYHEPSYEKYDDGYGYEHKYDYKPSYKYKRSVYGYGGDGKSYGRY